MTDQNPLEAEGAPREGNAQAIIDIATAATTPADISGANLVYATVPAGGTGWVIDPALHGETSALHPLRLRGTSQGHDATSLAAFVIKYGLDNTEVWASERDRQIVAVINAGGSSFEPGWADHRCTYTARRTPEWEEWVKQDGKMLEQVEFAELIEDNLSYIVQPEALDMLEVAQSIEGSKDATFKSSTRLRTGERRLSYEETVQAQAGAGGDIDVPETFTIRLAPYEGSDVVDVQIRLRIRITGGKLKIGYKIVEREQLERDAFRSVVASVNATLAAVDDRDYRPVLMGVPADAVTPLRP